MSVICRCVRHVSAHHRWCAMASFKHSLVNSNMFLHTGEIVYARNYSPPIRLQFTCGIVTLDLGARPAKHSVNQHCFVHESFKLLGNREHRSLYFPSMFARSCSCWSVGLLVSHAKLQNRLQHACQLFLFHISFASNSTDVSVKLQIGTIVEPSVFFIWVKEPTPENTISLKKRSEENAVCP